MVEVLVFQLSAVCHLQLRSEHVAFLASSLGCSLNIPVEVALSISLLDLVLSFWSSIPRRQSVRCIRSKLTFFCGVVSFTTGLTGWVPQVSQGGSHRSPVFLIFCIACVGFVGNFFGGVRVCLTTTISIAIMVGTFRVISGLVFFWFELTTLVPIVTWVFAVVASWLGFFGVLLCSLLRHSVYLQFIWGFQTIQLHFLFKMRHKLFICAILQIRLVN